MECRAAVSQTVLPCQRVQTDTALQAVCRCLSGDRQAFLLRNPEFRPVAAAPFQYLMTCKVCLPGNTAECCIGGSPSAFKSDIKSDNYPRLWFLNRCVYNNNFSLCLKLVLQFILLNLSCFHTCAVLCLLTSNQGLFSALIWSV